MSTSILQHTPWRRAALLSVPLALGALVMNIDYSNAAQAPANSRPQFERVRFADVIAATQPAVVQIRVSKSFGSESAPMAQFGGGAFEEFLRRFGQRPMPQTPPGNAPEATGVGSGFIIDAEGYVVTNHHVVSDASKIEIVLNDGRELEARLVGHDEQTDLALIKVDATDLPSIEFGDSDAIRVGDWVVAIGSPFGFGGSATAGIISARGRDIQSGPYDDFLQFDAPINRGNSGGPIIDAGGKVVGVNTAIFSPNGGNIGIGFAIPSAEASRIVNDLKTNGSVTRGWLGVQIQPVSEQMGDAFGLEKNAGALVADVVNDSPAARAGLKAGDIITEFAGELINAPRDLSLAVAKTTPGSKQRLSVIRQGKVRQLTALIDRNRATPLAANGASSPATEDTLGLGLALGSLNDRTRQNMRVDEAIDGALVLGIKNGSPAAAGGIQPGDIIVQVNQQPVSDVSAAETALAEAKRKDKPAVILLNRNGSQFFTTVRMS